MGQKITNEGDCKYCKSQLKGVWYKGMYPEDEELLEIHCNTCGASWDSDGIPRAIPSEERLEALGVLEQAKELDLPITKEPEWSLEYQKIL